ncbi:MAG: type II toxin-antitoxin system YhaV family toxin [Xenococcus sp. (in: cyanobacteria)]
MSSNQSLIVNGWRIYAHPLFLNQFEELLTTVENLRQKNPETYRSKNATKRLAAISKLAFEIIPNDPTRKEYRQGNALGEDYKHWFRAKFFQRCDPAPPSGARECAPREQYRLFFRYHQSSKIIVYAWINDDKSKRAYGSKTDAYRVFQKMLNNDNPPDNWNSLLEEAKRERERLSKAVEAQKSN